MHHQPKIFTATEFCNPKRSLIIFCALLSGVLLTILINRESSPETLYSTLLRRPPTLLRNSSALTSKVTESKWRKSRLVIIPAVHAEVDWYQPSTWPQWLRNGLDRFSNDTHRPYDVYLYQRHDPESKFPFNWPYCKNVHEEAGVYLKFIYDHYYDLPEKMLFVHGKPERHGLYPIEAGQCVREDVYYASVNNIWFGNRPWIAGSPDPIDNITLMYKCARRLLSLFGFDGEAQLNPTEKIPKDHSVFSTMCCAQFYVRRERIHHYTYGQWASAYNASLEPYCTTSLDRELTGVPGLKSFGSAFEFLWHIILGLESADMPIPRANTNTDLCHLFRSSCFGSLCKAAMNRAISSPV